MNTMRRITIVALVMALVAIPTAAFALDDAATDTEPVITDRPIRDAVRDAVTDHRERDLSEIKARALETINKQLEALGRLRAAIGNSRHITGLIPASCWATSAGPQEASSHWPEK